MQALPHFTPNCAGRATQTLDIELLTYRGRWWSLLLRKHMMPLLIHAVTMLLRHMLVFAPKQTHPAREKAKDHVMTPLLEERGQNQQMGRNESIGSGRESRAQWVQWSLGQRVSGRFCVVVSHELYLCRAQESCI